MEYMSVLLVFAALIAIVTAQPQLCAVQDGDFNDGNSCLTFIRCRNGVPARFACPRRLPFFDQQNHHCTRRRQFNCVMPNPFAVQGPFGVVQRQQPAINQVQVAGVPAGVGQAAGGLVADPNAFSLPVAGANPGGAQAAQPAVVPAVAGGLPAAGVGANAAVVGGNAGAGAGVLPGWAGANVRAGAGVDNQAGIGFPGQQQQQQPQLNPALFNNNINPAGGAFTNANVGGGAGVVPGRGVAVVGFVPPAQQLGGNANVGGAGGFLNVPQGQGRLVGARAGFVNGNVAAGSATAGAATAVGAANNGAAVGAEGQGQGNQGNQPARGQGRVLGVLPFGLVANQRQTATINQNQSVGVQAGGGGHS